MHNDWWRTAVIYQIDPRSFMDSNGDGVGDLQGITTSLPYVADLGVDAVWISSFCQSPLRGVDHGVSDYCQVDPVLGTLADFDVLLDTAHALGLKVIIDQVLSYTSDQHAWFQASRQSQKNFWASWYVWEDAQPDGSPPNNWLSISGGSAWHWDSRRCQYYLHSSLANQPDLNFHDVQVQDALLEQLRFWCDRGVDGFRFDACNHYFHDPSLRSNLPAVRQKLKSVRSDSPYAMQLHWYDKSQPENLAFLERVRDVLDEYGVVGIGEVDDEDAPTLMADYTEGDKRLHMACGFSLLTAEHTAPYLRDQIRRLDRLLDLSGGWAFWALSSHDVPRVASRWATAPVQLWLTLLMVLRGTACLYQGDELGLPEAEALLEQIPLMVDTPQVDNAGMLHFCKQLIQWRRAESTLLNGNMRWIGVAEPLLGIVREVSGLAPLVVVFNLSGEAQVVKLSAPGLQVLSDSPVPQNMAGSVEAGRVLLPPHGIFIGTSDA